MTGEDLESGDDPKVEKGSAWTPLREPTFRMLWLVWLVSNVCLWMNDVAAAWLMTSLTSSPMLIALVQTASSLPVFLLGLPSGALADIIDRRRYFLVTQFWVATNAAVLYAVSIAAAFALSRWKRETKPSVLPGERFIGAMRLGWQFVRESRRMRDALVRTTAFFLHSAALFALLPLVAKGLGDGGPGIYTLLLASMGVGAIFTATQLPRVRGSWDRDQVASIGSVLAAFALAALSFPPNACIPAPAMFVGGMAWILVANSVTIAAQLALTDWERARGLAI